MELTQDLLNELFYYSDGVLYWAVDGCNQVKSGSPAGWVDGKYKRVEINRKVYLVHRIIYMMHHGYLPEFVDHINGNPQDNRIVNLRAATRSENNRNSAPKRCTSGVKGVSWVRANKKWKAQLCYEGKQHYLGLYDTLEEAAEVVRKAREQHHGEFARHI